MGLGGCKGRSILLYQLWGDDLAIASSVYEKRFQSPLAQLMIQRGQVNLMVFDSNQEVVVQWIEVSNIDR